MKSPVVYEDDQNPFPLDGLINGDYGIHGEGVPTEYEDFSLGVVSSTVLSRRAGLKETVIETDEYNITVNWSQPGWTDYRIEPVFTSDFMRHQRLNPLHSGQGTVDEFGNPLDDVNMTIASWGLEGNVAWFNESCQEFSLNHTFTLFRDYMELNVTYVPGTKKVLTTYFIALFSESGSLYDMFDGGYHRYIPGYSEEHPGSHGMGGWYPTYKMFAPAMDMRVPYGDMGVEWGYSDTVAYIHSPIVSADHGGGSSAFSLKYTSLNSVVPNVGLGSSETFHMFIRPYQYDDGKDRGYDVGYAQWVTDKIVDEWGYHDTSVFPLAVMGTAGWSTEFRNWIESSQTKVGTFTQNPDQIDWNYGSAWQRNRVPADNPLLIPDEWELWGPGDQPQFAGDGDVILNPVSGTYRDVGSFRHHLIEDHPNTNWWWGSDAVFWDEMNVHTADVRPRNDYHNRSEFVYEGYLKLVQESYESGHWNFTIANSFTAMLHLSMVSDLSVVESYRPSSFFGVDFVNHVQSTMMFVNNIPEQYRPNILVYQYYDPTDNPDDQEDVYRILFDSAKYGFHVALVSWDNQSAQIHNLEMAEKMYLAMGASRDEGVQMQAETLDLDIEDSVNTSSRAIVWTGDANTPNISLANQEDSYNFTNLRNVPTNFDVSINTNKYYLPGSSSITGRMTFQTSGKARFDGRIEAEKTENILRMDSFQVQHQDNGEAVVELFELSENVVMFSLLSSEGKTNFTIGGLLHDTEYALLVDGGNRKILISSTSGHLMFVIPSDGDQSITLTLNTDAPVTDLLIGSPHSLVGEITIITSSTHLTLNVHDIKGIGIDFTTYRTWNLNQWSNWQTYSNPFTVGGDDGNRFVEYYSVDNSGSIEITKNSTIVLDNTPPNTNVSISQPNYGNAPAYVGKTTEISLIAMDEVAGIDATWFRVDSEPFDSYLGPFNLSRYRGMHVVEYGSVDMVGNNESVNDILVYVDDVPPISIIHVGVPRALHDGAIYANSETEFSISLTDEGSGSESIWFRVDNGDWTPYDGAYTISEEGPHKISYNSTDNLGNHEEPKSIEVFVDNTAPTANAGSYDEVERGSAFSFNGTLSEDNSLIVSFTWSVNDILLHGMNPPFTFNRTGKYIVKLTVSDALGNEDIDTVRIEVTDTTPPVPPTGIEVEPQGWGVLQISWNPGLDEDLSGYHVYKSDNPGGPYFRISEVIVTQTCFGDTELLDGGTYFYMVTAVDSSGNEGRRSLEAFGTTLSSPELVFPSEYWWVMAVTLILMPVFTVLFLVIRREKEKHAVE